MKQTVPNNCLDMCSYNVDFNSNAIVSILMRCKTYIPMILMCAAGK